MRVEMSPMTQPSASQGPAKPRRSDSGKSKTLWIRPASRLDGPGLITADDFLAIPGEIVSGHPNRHVMRVRIAGRTAYLKREHRVRLRDRFRHWREGFGWVSKSSREAAMLLQLEAAKISAPRVLAYGEDRQGRAFLLVEEVGATELRRFLRDVDRPSDREELAARLGRWLAELHGAGFHHPDPYAKHFLIDPTTYEPTLLDWQRGIRRIPDDAQRIRALASLDAGLADQLASPRQRLRFLWAYRRVVRRSQGIAEIGAFHVLARAIQRRSRSLRDRPSLREQRQTPLPTHSQRLVWLDGEALCVIPELVEDFRKPFVRRMLEDGAGERQWLILTGCRTGKLEVHRYPRALGRWWARLRGRSWRSPELRRARLLFHLERHHIAAPKLLAFGQREAFGRAATAFLVSEPVPEAIPIWEWYDAAEPPQRLRLLRDLGAFLARLHEAGCLLDSTKAVVMSEAESSNVPAIADITRITFSRRIRDEQKRSQLARLWRELRLRRRRTEGLRILLGYLHQARLAPEAKKLVRSILREAR